MTQHIHIITPEYPPAIGGVADYTKQIAHGLVSTGEDVHVWCAAIGDDSGDPRVHVHEAGGPDGCLDLDRTAAGLDQYPAPRRVLVQWVPHGYGRRSMNVAFCVWLWRRALAGDRIELMVHEPYLAFGEGSWRQAAAAVVHRVMTVILLRAATRVWVSIPAWEARWRPYAFGRRVPFAWLPIPTALSPVDVHAVSEVRTRLGSARRPIVGHFGTFGALVTTALDEVLPHILTRRPDAEVVLIGAGSDRYAGSFLQRHSSWHSRVHATGPLDAGRLASHVAACDVLVQPYPDGVSSRRTTAMAGMFLGVPVVTTSGHLTEPFWRDSGIVGLTPVGDWPAMAGQVCRLLGDAEGRNRMSEHARRFYDRTFDMRHTIAALTATK